MDPNSDSSGGSWSDALTSLISTGGSAFNAYEYANNQPGNRPIIYGPGVAPYGNPGFQSMTSGGSSSLLWIVLLALVGVFAFMRMK